METPKYEYHLKTWGGFYNKEYLDIHQQPRGDFWFDTDSERQDFIDKLRKIEEKLNARHLAMTMSEGYCTRIMTTCHRVIEDEKGDRHYSTLDMGYNYPIDAAKFHMEYKWYPGFNSYPLGEDYDYSKCNEIAIWVTGADTNKCDW